jgi:catechol 2,3-dioxygenase-like lactoylglutathione lyase family enzyme
LSIKQSIARIALLVKNYDEAIAYYVDTMGFDLIEDTALPDEDKRWVVIAPPGSDGTELLLAQAKGAAQLARVGDQTGGRVFCILQTDDFWRDHHTLVSRGVVFTESPREEVYGTVAVFEDLYGNLWDLLQPSS